MRPLKFTSKVIGGKLIEDVAKSIGRAIALFDGKFLTVELREYHPTRSNQQNRFLFGVIYPLIVEKLREGGAVLDVEDVHDWTVTKIWKHREAIIMPDGEVYLKRLSSTKLSKMEFEENLTLTRAFWAERGLILPFPNEAFYGDE